METSGFRRTSLVKFRFWYVATDHILRGNGEPMFRVEPINETRV
ncbi:hypothetical protein HALLA_19805 (plasmid) [Halostagnicola larsenii XH-48]|uniref:Uncharacterized protein n=1 Tax=Halostagnicola larsenii XH-48 TaxID=797299 RepID=W0JU66_9EURY|nr:hypothetical protein HALLA_19805 [Halostagnicola larsenii XH-48]